MSARWARMHLLAALSDSRARHGFPAPPWPGRQLTDSVGHCVWCYFEPYLGLLLLKLVVTNFAVSFRYSQSQPSIFYEQAQTVWKAAPSQLSRVLGKSGFRSFDGPAHAGLGIYEFILC
jgi:hypothetical protein